MTVKEFLIATVLDDSGHRMMVRPYACCGDGLRLSIQASNTHYCRPRRNLLDGEYTDVEVLIDTSEFTTNELLRFDKHSGENEPFDIRLQLYGYVNMRFLEQFVKEHGGIVKFEKC